VCNLSFDVVRVLRTQPLCLLFYCVTFLLTLFGSSPKKLFATTYFKCATSFLSLSCFNSLNLWRLNTFESCHSLQALPTNLKMWFHLVFFFLYIVFNLCVFFMNMGCSSLEMYENLYWVNFKPKSNTNE